jgi:hypothetical protein
VVACTVVLLLWRARSHAGSQALCLPLVVALSHFSRFLSLTHVCVDLFLALSRGLSRAAAALLMDKAGPLGVLGAAAGTDRITMQVHTTLTLLCVLTSLA